MRTNHPFIRMVYHPVLSHFVPSSGQTKEQRPHLFKKSGASVHFTEQNMNYICYDKKNCLNWTKRINKPVRDRIVVCFLRSGTSTRRVMEIRERYELFCMLYAATTNNSTPHDTQHHALLEDKRTSSCPQSVQGCITRPAAKLTLTTIQNILCSRTRMKNFGADRNVGWHLSLEFILFYRFKVES